MMRRRPPYIPQREPVFIGCEGASEVAYAEHLRDLSRACNANVYPIIEDLGLGAGDPLARIMMAKRKLDWLQKKREAPKKRFVLLDSDQIADHHERAEEAKRLAAVNGITIIWQHPCFEAVLLRHLPEQASRRPPDTAGAERALQREWPEYRKPMDKLILATRIDRAAIQRASAVEPELSLLIAFLGLL